MNTQFVVTSPHKIQFHALDAGKKAGQKHTAATGTNTCSWIVSNRKNNKLMTCKLSVSTTETKTWYQQLNRFDQEEKQINEMQALRYHLDENMIANQQNRWTHSLSRLLLTWFNFMRTHSLDPSWKETNGGQHCLMHRASTAPPRNDAGKITGRTQLFRAQSF